MIMFISDLDGSLHLLYHGTCIWYDARTLSQTVTDPTGICMNKINDIALPPEFAVFFNTTHVHIFPRS